MPKIKLNDLDYGGSPTVEDADHLMVADTRNQTLSAQNIITNILGDMAQLEHNATASKAYAKGEYLVLGSYFYKATAAIAQGDTLVAGTNIEQTNVGAEMSELNSNANKTASGSGNSGLAAMNSLISNMGGNNMVLFRPYGAVLTNAAWDTAYGWLMRIATNDYLFQGANKNGHHVYLRVANGSLATNKSCAYS